MISARLCVPLYSQSATGYCGPASLRMVLDYHGVKKSERHLARLAGVDGEGSGAHDLLKAVRVLGFEGFVKDYATIKDIRKYVAGMRVPVIVDWFAGNDGHFSVVTGIDDKNVYMQDPERGEGIEMLINDFYKVWFDYQGDRPKSKKDFYIRRMLVVRPKGNGAEK